MKHATSQPAGGLMLLPPRAGLCQICATKHEPHLPHNAQSLFYGVRFKMLHGRDGTWEDAAAHCTPQMRFLWKAQLEAHGAAWTSPPEGVEPIKEPIDG